MGNVSENYSEWLDQIDWDYFGTFTTRYPLTLRSARRVMERLGKQVNSPGSRMFWVAEDFEVREGYHTHALLKTWWSPNMIWKWWFLRYGRAVVRLYEPGIGGTGYIAKYVMKAIIDYDLII